MGSDVRLRSSGVEWRAVDGEVVVLDLVTSKYLTVNDTGAVLWEPLVAGASREDLVRALVEGFGVDDATARADVAAFLDDLAAHGLLEP